MAVSTGSHDEKDGPGHVMLGVGILRVVRRRDAKRKEEEVDDDDDDDDANDEEEEEELKVVEEEEVGREGPCRRRTHNDCTNAAS